MLRGVDRFVNRREAPVISPVKPQAIREQVSGNGPDGGNRRARELHVPVPVTRLGPTPDDNVSGLPALAEAVAARYPLSPLLEDSVIARNNKFDETDLEDSTINSADGLHWGNLMVDQQQTAQRYSEEERDYEAGPEPDGGDQGEQIPDDVYHHKSLSEEIAEARRLYPENARYFQAQSPSLRKIKENPINPVNPSYGLAPAVARSPSRPRTSHRNGIPPRASHPVEKSVILPATANALPITTSFDKTCSFTDSAPEISPSSQEVPTAESRKKRPRPELLDYDLASLKTMSFDILVNQPFDLDPRCPPRLDPGSSSTSSSSDGHRQKLSNLKSLSDGERSRFFCSQSKEQWSESMTFLGKRLEELLGELDVARNRRRDVAGRFEAEIGERMRDVQMTAEGIDGCLADIRGKARGVLPGRNEKG